MKPRPADGYREAASLITIEHLLDLVTHDAIEIIWHGELALHKIQPLDLFPNRRIEGHHLDHRLAGFGDDERFALRGLLDEFGEIGLGFVDINNVHGAPW